VRIGYDNTFTRGNLGGSGTYARELRRALSALCDIEVADLEGSGRGPLRSISWLLRGAQRAARRAGACLLHEPAPVPPLAVNVPLVLTIHDASVFEYPDDFPRDWREFQIRVLPLLARRARVIVTGSEHAKSEIVSGFGVHADKVMVTPYGVTMPKTAPSRENPGGAPVLVFVGAPLRRKNLDVVLRALATPIGRRARARAAIVGANAIDYPRYQVMAKELDVADRLDWFGRVPPKEMTRIFDSASALIYPSFHEGFGFPPLEAMARGLPVIASRESCLPEVLGDGAAFVDPRDEVAVAGALERIAEDRDFHQQLVERGRQRASQFTWDRCARLTLEVYRRVCDT